MAVFVKLNRRTQQPQTVAGVDWNNPLTRNLGRVITPSSRLLNVARNEVGSGVNNVVINPRGFSATAGSASAIVLSDFPATRYTCLFVAVTYTASGLEPRLVSRSDGSTTFNQNYALNLNVGTTPRAGHKQVSNNAYPYVQSTISVAAGNVCVGVSTYDGSVVKVFTNGRLGGSVSASDPYTSLGASGATQFLNSDGTNRASASAYQGPGMSLGAIWDRALSESEVFEISVNPWQLFRPQRQVFYSLAGGVFSLSLDAGAYTLTGRDVSTTSSRNIALDAGSYTLTGRAVDFSFGRQLVLDAGSYNLTGRNVDLTSARSLGLDAGSYALTGRDVTLTYLAPGNFTLALDAGSYALTGRDVNFNVTLNMLLDSGAYNLTGRVVGLTWSGETPVVITDTIITLRSLTERWRM